MIDFTKWRVQDMRAELIRLTGDDITTVEAIKGKEALAERILEVRQKLGLDRIDYNINEVELENNSMIIETEVNDEEEVSAPEMGSPLWQEYVLSHLTDDEIVIKDSKKFPKSMGLRRVAQILCGPIVNCGPSQVFPMGNATTIVYSVTFLWKQGLNIPQYMTEDDIVKLNLPTRTFSDVSDCSEKNTPAPYCYHHAATACTKAAGRVFKIALGLNCHTAEEMALVVEEEKMTEASMSNMDNEGISSNQKITIEKLASRNGIDVSKALELHAWNPDVNALSRVEAASFITILNRYQTSADGSMEIPDSIKSV